MFLKQQFHCTPLDVNLLKIVKHVSTYKDNELCQFMAEAIDYIGIHRKSVEEQNFDNYIALIETGVEFENFPCTKSGIF